MTGAPSKAAYLVCPHCRNDGLRGAPHALVHCDHSETDESVVMVSAGQFRCGDCKVVSPMWTYRRRVGMVSHVRDGVTGEAIVPGVGPVDFWVPEAPGGPLQVEYGGEG